MSAVKQLVENIFEAMRQYKVPELRLSAIGSCPKYLVSAALGVEGDEAEMAEGVLEFGRVWHERIEEIATANGWICEMEVELNFDGLKILGHVDAYEPETRTLVDFKVVSQSAKPFLPKREHLLQITAYSLATPIIPISYPPKHLALIYMFREDPTLRKSVIYEYSIDDLSAYANEIYNILTTLKGYIDKKQVPPTPAGYHKDKYPCRWKTDYGLDVKCPYWKMCWGDETSEETELQEQLFVTELESQLIEIYEKRKLYQRLLSEIDEQFKALLQKITANKDPKQSYPLSEKYVLVYKERKDVDKAIVQQKLGYIPTKTIGWWQVIERSEGK